MTVHMVGEKSMVLFLDSEDMDARGISCESLDSGAARDIVAETFGESGMRGRSGIVIEAFTRSGGAMIFVRAARPLRLVFRFGSCDDAIDAMRILGGRVPEYSAFTYYDGCYYLQISSEAESAGAALSEFGDEVLDGELFSGILSEYGESIAGENAVLKVISAG